MRKGKPNHVQNTAVKPSWGQLFREVTCSIKGHVFHVAWGDGYRGLSQSHCFRCGKKGPMAIPSCEEWVKPIG